MVNQVNFPRVETLPTTLIMPSLQHIQIATKWFQIPDAPHILQTIIPHCWLKHQYPRVSPLLLPTTPLSQALQKASYHFPDHFSSLAIGCRPSISLCSQSARPRTPEPPLYSQQQECSLPTTMTSQSNLKIHHLSLELEPLQASGE